MFQRQCMYSFSACLLWERMQSGVWLKHISLWGQQGLFNCEVWCGWCDFSRNMPLNCSPTSVWMQISVSVLVTAWLYICHSMSMFVKRYCNIDVVESRLLSPLGFLSSEKRSEIRRGRLWKVTLSWGSVRDTGVILVPIVELSCNRLSWPSEPRWRSPMW